MENPDLSSQSPPNCVRDSGIDYPHVQPVVTAVSSQTARMSDLSQFTLVFSYSFFGEGEVIGIQW